MDVTPGRRILRRVTFIVASVALVTLLAVASLVGAVRYREWHNAREHRERVAVATASAKRGMSSAQIKKMLGEPTFVERKISDMFTPSDATCQQRSESSFIYQAMPEQTLVVFFDEQDRVTCVETTTAFMIMHRVE